jgi:hypothetical protein
MSGEIKMAFAVATAGLDRTRRDELKQLKRVEEESFASRERFRERPYLQAVYELYCDWADDRHSKARSAQMARLNGISPRKDSHPIRIIIDCSSPSTEERIKSRWTRALRFALAKRVPPSKLLDLLDEEGRGGLAGLASAFTKWQRIQRMGRNKRSPQGR